MRRILFFLLLPFPLLAQLTYTVDQSIPVVVNGTKLLNPWAGGINSAQIEKMDLNADGVEDLVIYDNTTDKLNTFLANNGKYVYAPEYEVLFPAEVSTYAVLRDYNCDGKKDLFTFGDIGILVFQNVTPPGGKLTWKKIKFYNPTSGLKSEVLLTLGLSGMINLLPGTNDLPNFTDIDGDGDLDVLNMKFVSPSSAEYHRNFSMERYGTCDSLTLERQTTNWGGFEECSCGIIAFGQTCVQLAGGRAEHTGGKVLLTIDVDNDGDKDLFYSEEACTSIYFMENHGTSNNAVMNSAVQYPATTPVTILFPAPFFEDMDFDGKSDLVATSNLYVRTDLTNNFQQSVWFYKNTGTNQLPNFAFVKNNLLQEDMIDVGDFSAPAFTDLDNDGDQDMIIGRYTNNNSRGSLYYYENNGSAQSPSFNFVTDDLYGLSILNYYNLKPQFADLDKNGGADLIFTATSLLNGKTNLYYVLSKSNTAPSFGGALIQVVSGITLEATENVCVTDVDSDGRSDLLIGRYTGALEYWRNSGNGFSFFLTNSKYLGLDSNPLRQSVTASPGDLDGDGREDLAIGDQKGVVTIYSDYRTTGSQPTTNIIYDTFSKTYLTKNLGGRIRPAVVNLMGTDKPEIVTGNTQGGLYVLKNDNGLILTENPQIVVFPNPVPNGQSISIKSDRNVIMDVFTILGQPIGSSMAIPAEQIMNYPLQNIASGIYIARFTAGSKSTSLRFIIK